jgi:hypothetical protein
MRRNGEGAIVQTMAANRRRSRRRKMRRNDFMAMLRPALTTGASVLGGFLVHRAASNVVSEKVLTMVGWEPDSSRETSADKLIDKSLLRSIKI